MSRFAFRFTTSSAANCDGSCAARTFSATMILAGIAAAVSVLFMLMLALSVSLRLCLAVSIIILIIAILVCVLSVRSFPPRRKR